jgi:hypothetical protein
MNHFSVTGFKRRKRNKRTHTLFITTTLSINEIAKALKKWKYEYNSIVDIDSFTDKPDTWRKNDDIRVDLTLFDELFIIKVIAA